MLNVCHPDRVILRESNSCVPCWLSVVRIGLSSVSPSRTGPAATRNRTRDPQIQRPGAPPLDCASACEPFKILPIEISCYIISYAVISNCINYMTIWYNILYDAPPEKKSLRNTNLQSTKSGRPECAAEAGTKGAILFRRQAGSATSFRFCRTADRFLTQTPAWSSNPHGPSFGRILIGVS